MKGLIRRAEVVGKITSADKQMAYRQMTGTEVYQEILGILNEAQDVDAEPVTYGEWVYGIDGCHCSECGYEPENVTERCPHCGAIMEDAEEWTD